MRILIRKRNESQGCRKISEFRQQQLSSFYACRMYWPALQTNESKGRIVGFDGYQTGPKMRHSVAIGSKTCGCVSEEKDANRVRVVLDRYAFAERKAIMEESGCAPIEAAQVAAVEGYSTGFALAATAMANDDPGPAKELCRREMQRHGREHALELWSAIQEAVNEA